ncbi:MAG: hypothetical protein LW860_16435 [Xanthomonadaceae bacterium]|jgi:hypothetical protein|nr:hypothetical protein [Xanthomonadaceae bacterium]
MDEKKKGELVDAFVYATRPPLSQRHRSDSWLAVRGNNNQIRVVLSGHHRAAVDDDGSMRRKLIGQALAHVRRVGATAMFRSWMLRTYGSPLLSQLTTAELRQAHREVMGWRSAAG